MSKILPDYEIKKILGTVIKGGELKLVNPNGIELRLGNHIKFISTGEEKEIPCGSFIRVGPGESVIIASLESIDFSRETVGEHFPECMLMGFITPTTTMMREGISQAATKIDPGFVGQLNWGLRNSSFKDFTIGYGESIFKLTIFALQGDEVPEMNYGERAEDKYQNTEGIRGSGRRIPADISKNKIVSSSSEKLDPKKQLREAGYPFDHIGSELIRLDGKFEMVSADVRALTGKIEDETASVLGKLDDLKKWLMDHVDNQFSKRFAAIIGTIVTVILATVAVLKFFQSMDMGSGVTIVLFSGAAIVALALTLIISNRFK